MHNVPIPPDRVQDPFEKNVPGLGLGRDPARTPMQWSAGPNADFTKGLPWLPIAADYSTSNVESQMADPASILHLYRRLIELRRREPALSVGQFAAVPAAGDLLAYRRQHRDASRFLIILNFAGEPATFQSPVLPPHSTIVLSTSLDRDNENVRTAIELRANEGLIVQLTYT
jgi:alpha-glucosidase